MTTLDKPCVPCRWCRGEGWVLDETVDHDDVWVMCNGCNATGRDEPIGVRAPALGESA